MANKKGHPDNLKTNRSPVEARLNGKKGGKKSGKTRRQRKSLKSTLHFLLNLPVPPNFSNELSELNIPETEGNMQLLLLLALIKEGLKGDVSAIKTLATLIGELEPKETKKPNDLNLMKVLVDLHKEAKDDL